MVGIGINVIFGRAANLVRILEGLGVTVGISALSVVLSLVLGVFVGLACVRAGEPCAGSCSSTSSSCASCPSSFSSSWPTSGSRASRGINLDGITASVLVFTLWGGAEMGDLVRGALIAIPRHQYESAYALGLTPSRPCAA